MQENHLRQLLYNLTTLSKNLTVIYEVQPQKPHRLCCFMQLNVVTCFEATDFGREFTIEPDLQAASPKETSILDWN